MQREDSTLLFVSGFCKSCSVREVSSVLTAGGSSQPHSSCVQPWSSGFHTQSSTSPAQASFPCFFFNAESSNPLAQLVPLLSDSTGGILGTKLHRANRSPALSKCLPLPPSLSVAGNPPLSTAAGTIFLNCVYLLAPWCESASHQLHINLVSSLWTFSSLSGLTNLWLLGLLLPSIPTSHCN